MSNRKISAGMAAFAFAAIATLGALNRASAECGGIEQATLEEPNQKTQEVSTQEVRRILADASALLIDSRSDAQYAAGHIPGARNVSGPQAVATVTKLVDGDRSKALVLYCNGPFCQASRRLGEQLVAAGFTNVRRYQLGIPVWRALGGPTAIEPEGVLRVLERDRTAVFLDARSADEFAKGSLPGAHNVPADQIASGALKRAPLPEDDFNTRIVLFGRDAAQARALADAMSKRPWHNVSYLAGSFDQLKVASKSRR
jgi:rhodanese-related sulfurtransferase